MQRTIVPASSPGFFAQVATLSVRAAAEELTRRGVPTPSGGRAGGTRRRWPGCGRGWRREPARRLLRPGGSVRPRRQRRGRSPFREVGPGRVGLQDQLAGRNAIRKCAHSGRASLRFAMTDGLVRVALEWNVRVGSHHPQVETDNADSFPLIKHFRIDRVLPDRLAVEYAEHVVGGLHRHAID